MACKVSIIIPVHNERPVIEAVLKRVTSAPLPPSCEKEIIVVDDGSTDGTTQLLRNTGNTGIATVHTSMHHFGEGTAIRTGIALSSGNIILIQDCDLQYDPNYVMLLEPLMNGTADVVYGSRFVGHPSGMKLANRLLTLIANILYSAKITDDDAPWKAFRREVLDRILLSCKHSDFSAEVTAKIRRYGYSIDEVPISYHARSADGGKRITVKDGFQALWALFRYRLSPVSSFSALRPTAKLDSDPRCVSPSEPLDSSDMAPSATQSQETYSIWDISILLSVSIVFLSLCLYQINLPGLYGDELDKVVPTVSLLTGRPFLSAGWTQSIFGHRILLAFTDRIGAVLSYLPMPFIYLFGYTPYALRLSSVICALLTLYFAYFGARLWCGSWTARFGILLTAVSPVFVFLQRMGYYNYGPVTMFTSMTFLFLARYKVRQRSADLWASAVFAGIAINTALQAVFVLIPMAIMAVFFQKPIRPRVRGFVVALCVFLAVGSPVLITGIRTGAMLGRIGWNQAATSSGGLTGFADTVVFHTSMISHMLGGVDPIQGAAMGHPVDNVWMRRSFLLAIGVILFAFATTKLRKTLLLRQGAPLVITLSGLFLSGFILNEGRITYQLIVFWPFVTLVVAAGLALICERFRPVRVIVIAVVCALVVTQARTTLQGHRLLAQVRGKGNTSSQVYPLVDYLMGLKNVHVISMDWGLLNQIYYLTGGEIMPEALHGWWPRHGVAPTEFETAVLRVLQDPTNVFVFFGPGEGWDRYPDVERLAEGANKVLKIEKIFYERDSSIAYRVARAVDAAKTESAESTSEAMK